MTEPWAKLYASAQREVARKGGYAAAYVYSILLSFDNPRKPGCCFPSVKAIAERAGMPERTLRTHLATLQEIGAVKVRKRYGIRRRGRACNSYEFPDSKGGFTGNSPAGKSESDTGCAAAAKSELKSGRSSAANSSFTGHPSAAKSQDLPAAPLPLLYKDEQTSTTNRPVLLDHHHSARVPDEHLPPEVSMPETVVVFIEDEGLNDKAKKIFFDQIVACCREHGAEPANLALGELGSSFDKGQRPKVPNRLSGYFAPILKRHIKAWKEEMAEKAGEEAAQAAKEQRRLEVAAEIAARQAGGAVSPFADYLHKWGMDDKAAKANASS